MRFILFTLLLLPACTPSSEPVLTVAAASSLRPVLTEIAREYTQATGVPVELVFGSSGKLAAQLTAGAPYDLLLAADSLYPAQLLQTGVASDTARTFAYGPVVVWSILPDISLVPDSLFSESIERIAVPNPTVAPYGRAVADHLRARSSWEGLAPKLVYGESVGQANQFVYSGAAEVGFTALASLRMLDRSYRFEPLPVPPLPQVGVVIRASTRTDAAEAFLAHLSTEPAQLTLRKFGYLTDR